VDGSTARSDQGEYPVHGTGGHDCPGTVPRRPAGQSGRSVEQ